MNLNKWSSLVSRLFFGVAFVLLAISVCERVANASGYTLLHHTYTAGRLLELASLLVIFVIALLLRDVREELRKAGT
jgi:hypothetical protein